MHRVALHPVGGGNEDLRFRRRQFVSRAEAENPRVFQKTPDDAFNFDVFGLGGRGGNEILFYIYVAAMAILFGILCHFFADVMMKILTGLSGGIFIVGGCVYVVEAFKHSRVANIVDYLQGLFSNVFNGGASTGVATAAIATKVLTITGVAAGSTIVTITASKTNYATFKRTILVIVK